MRRFENLTELGRNDALTSFGCETDERFGGFVPFVEREIESAPVDRKEGSSAEHLEHFERVVGAEMNRPPRWMKRADLEHHQIEGPVLSSDDLEVVRVPCLPRRRSCVRRSESPKTTTASYSIPDAASRKMLARRRCEADSRNVDRLVPIELADSFGRDSERFEARADSERSHDRDGWHSSQIGDGFRAEMIVVVVRNEDDVERRKFRKPRGHRMKTFRSRERHGGGSLPEDGIGEHSIAVDLEEDRTVSEPRRSEATFDRTRPFVVRAKNRERFFRDAFRASEKEVRKHREGHSTS